MVIITALLSFLFRADDFKFWLLNLCDSRDIFIVFAPQISEIRIIEDCITALYWYFEVISHHNFQNLYSSALEVCQNLLDVAVFIGLCLVFRGVEDCNVPFSIAILAFGSKIGASVLFVHIHMFLEGDAYLFGEALVAAGAFNLGQPYDFFGDLDRLDFLCACA